MCLHNNGVDSGETTSEQTCSGRSLSDQLTYTRPYTEYTRKDAGWRSSAVQWRKDTDPLEEEACTGARFPGDQNDGHQLGFCFPDGIIGFYDKEVSAQAN